MNLVLVCQQNQSVVRCLVRLWVMFSEFSFVFFFFCTFSWRSICQSTEWKHTSLASISGLQCLAFSLQVANEFNRSGVPLTPQDRNALHFSSSAAEGGATNLLHLAVVCCFYQPPPPIPACRITITAQPRRLSALVSVFFSAHLTAKSDWTQTRNSDFCHSEKKRWCKIFVCQLDLPDKQGTTQQSLASFPNQQDTQLVPFNHCLRKFNVTASLFVLKQMSKLSVVCWCLFVAFSKESNSKRRLPLTFQCIPVFDPNCANMLHRWFL